MLLSSYFGKLRDRNSILGHLHVQGDETVLDVGCGHGLLLIAAAELLPRGRAVRVDLWSQADQAGNSHDATLRNAEIEGVAGRVDVCDGDMRNVRFPDETFNAAVAHFAIHNIPSHEGRREAVREIVSTLKPGSRIALSDLKSVGLYADELQKANERCKELGSEFLDLAALAYCDRNKTSRTVIIFVEFLCGNLPFKTAVVPWKCFKQAIPLLLDIRKRRLSCPEEGTQPIGELTSTSNHCPVGSRNCAHRCEILYMLLTRA